MLTLIEQSQEIFKQKPLPDDAPEQLDALIEQASGLERSFLIMSTEALYATATPEQLAIWNAEPDAPEQD
jgi:hypothetical protein